MWKGQHGMVLPDSWPLVMSLQLKLWKGVTAEPPAVETLLLEQLRLMTDVSKPMGTDLNVIPGKGVESSDCVAVTVRGPMEIFMRTRAWFMTMFMVSVRSPAWLSFQTAILPAIRSCRWFCTRMAVIILRHCISAPRGPQQIIISVHQFA